MQVCRFGLLWAVICAFAFVASASAQECGGCLDLGCAYCGPLSNAKLSDPYNLPFGVHPPAVLGTATFDLVALERNGADPQNVLFAGGNPVMNVTELNFIPEAGFRADIILPSQCGCDFNINVFGSGHDYASATHSDPGISFTWFGGVPITPATSYTVEYASELLSFELNFRTREWARFLPLAGFRVLTLEEKFNILTAPNTGLFSVIDNELYGFQVGGQALLWQWNRLRLESVIKAGVYYNDLDLRATANNAQLQRSSSSTAFAGEASLTFVFQCSPRTAIRAGYQGFWLGGVALAPDQSDDASFGTGLTAFDSAMVNYQGGTVGFELTW